ncbi:unnamed protein product [Penicillium salamii]|nr:unnamed protein product [Penicillium salamii]
MAEDKPVETERAEQPTEEVTAEMPETESTDKPEAQAEEPTSDKPEAKAEVPADGDAAEATPADAEAAPATAEVNGTPASAKKSSKNRRVSTGTPKLNRKKSQSRITHLNAKPGQYYLARLRSYAPWPAIICDDDILPETFLESRPVTAMQKDGSYKGEYADGGRRTHERTFPVMFLQTNEFAWIPNMSLSPLDPAECKDISEKNKSKGLVTAYKIASEGHDLDYFKKVLIDHQEAIEQELAEAEALDAEKEAEKEAAKVAKETKKGKRKSKAADTDVEMEDADDSKKAKPASKKRKKDADTDAEAEKPAKTPKSNTKLKLTTPKAPAEEKKTPVSKRKAPTKRGKAAAAPSDDDSSADPKESEKPVDPEDLKKKKEKESMLAPGSSPPIHEPPDDADHLYLSVLFLRHKLQKGFISRETPPAEDEMASMATYFDKLEKHADLEVSIIRSTKINKVLKMIVKLNTIPRDEEFNIRSRAMNILSSWKNVLDADTPGPADKSDKPPANGSKEDEGAETPKLETEEEKEAESKSAKDIDSPMPDADAEKAPEPEKEAEGEKPEQSTETTEKPTEAEEKTEKPAEEPTEEKAEATA